MAWYPSNPNAISTREKVACTELDLSTDNHSVGENIHHSYRNTDRLNAAGGGESQTVLRSSIYTLDIIACVQLSKETEITCVRDN